MVNLIVELNVVCALTAPTDWPVPHLSHCLSPETQQY